MNKTLPIIPILFLFVPYANAQQSIHSSGGNGSGANGTVSYSVGVVSYTTNSGPTGVVAQGVQHAFEIFVTGTLEPSVNISLSAFPNPASEYLSLQIGNYHGERYLYRLHDQSGKTLINGEVQSEFSQINTAGLASAMYFLQIISSQNQTLQTFKIIKN